MTRFEEKRHESRLAKKREIFAALASFGIETERYERYFEPYTFPPPVLIGQELYIANSEAASILRIHPDTLREWMKEGEGGIDTKRKLQVKFLTGSPEHGYYIAATSLETLEADKAREQWPLRWRRPRRAMGRPNEVRIDDEIYYGTKRAAEMSGVKAGTLRSWMLAARSSSGTALEIKRSDNDSPYIAAKSVNDLKAEVERKPSPSSSSKRPGRARQHPPVVPRPGR